MIKIKPTSLEKAEKYDVKDLFPDLSEALRKKINQDLKTKRELIDYVKKDRVGTQFNAVRLCKVPPDIKPLEEELESLEFDLENLEKDDERYSEFKKKVFKKRREIEKLKQPHRYFDDICECYQICPLYRNKMTPEGELCYFEAQKVAQATEGYLNEFEVDLATQNVAREQIAQIVLCDLIIYRANRALAVTNLSSISEKIGEFGVEYTRQRNHLLNLITEQNKTRNKLLETMLGTPEIRMKYKIENTKNIKQAEADKSTMELIKNKESIKRNKIPNLINVEQTDNTDIFTIEEAEVV